MFDCVVDDVPDMLIDDSIPDLVACSLADYDTRQAQHAEVLRDNGLAEFKFIHQLVYTARAVLMDVADDLDANDVCNGLQ